MSLSQPTSFYHEAPEDHSQCHGGCHHHQEPIQVTKIGRNDPCPCGRGVKYKKCCLK